MSEFKATRTAVVVTREPGGTTCLLQFGPHVRVRPGIEFEARVRLPSLRASGRLQFVQDVAIHRRRSPAVTNPTHSDECVTSRGAYMLDETDPYFEIRVTGIGPHVISTFDAPANSLNPSEIVEADDRFRMFLMWRPDRFGGRFRLSVARIEWWWKGTAEAEGTNPDCQEGQRGWKLTSDPSDHGGDANGVLTLSRPVTSQNIITVKRGGWQPC